MSLCWITITTEKMEESLKFYTEIAGLKIDSRFSPDENTDIAMLGDPESAKVELLCRKGYATVKNTKGISVGLRVDSLEGMLEKIKMNKIPIVSGPVSPSPGLSFFMVSDPNGVTVQFVEEKQ
ncbi:MAG: VOC family protein [Candidatus Methanomethylophilaceae archaeon]|jgi:lactoylglutathione lyase